VAEESAILFDMIAIIIAGGSGTRLWPLSTSDFPKQFLTIDDSGRSLLQKTYDRVKEIADSVYLVTSEQIYEESKRHLPEIEKNIVVEPSRKGVANALYLGFRRLIQDGIQNNEPIFVLWGDHLIHDEDTFRAMVIEANQSVKKGAKLVQFGIVPNHPSNQLGYIKKGKSGRYSDSIYEINSWKYQPDQETANEWYASGDYLWNAGYFVSTIDYVIGEIRRESPESFKEYEAIVEADDSDLETVYNAQEGAILDHVLSERMKSAHVIACTFDWIDVGNFHDLHSVSPVGDNDNYVKGEFEHLDVNESYMHNELDIPVAVVGLDNVVVVATEKGILVANKSQARKVGEVAKKIQG